MVQEPFHELTQQVKLYHPTSEMYLLLTGKLTEPDLTPHGRTQTAKSSENMARDVIDPVKEQVPQTGPDS